MNPADDYVKAFVKRCKQSKSYQGEDYYEKLLIKQMT